MHLATVYIMLLAKDELIILNEALLVEEVLQCGFG